jgi:triosephosphate isomerase
MDSLRELGCDYVEVGHAERRQLLGESDELVARKLARVCELEMTPLLCLGEPARVASSAASEYCIQQLRSALTHLESPAAIVVAYEPVWAIGQPSSAAASEIAPIIAALKKVVADTAHDVRYIYGGGAGPGTYDSIDKYVDGLFLGRSAHDVAGLTSSIEEVRQSSVGSARRPGPAAPPAQRQGARR